MYLMIFPLLIDLLQKFLIMTLTSRSSGLQISFIIFLQIQREQAQISHLVKWDKSRDFVTWSSFIQYFLNLAMIKEVFLLCECLFTKPLLEDLCKPWCYMVSLWPALPFAWLLYHISIADFNELFHPQVENIISKTEILFTYALLEVFVIYYTSDLRFLVVTFTPSHFVL